MRIALVLYGEIRSPVVASQTFPLLRKLRERGHEVHLFVLTSPRRRLTPRPWRDALAAAMDAAGGALTVLTHAPRHRRYGPAARRLARVLRKFAPDVVHARQSRGGIVAGRAGVAPVLLDLRGVRPEEFLLSLGKDEAGLMTRESEALARLRRED
ncbi:MAG: glycosyltransferase, partial [Planctomycetota bacterium]